MADAVEQHYTSDAIAERILTAVQATLPPGAPVTAEALAPIDHFHGRGVLATAELVARLQPQAQDKILDIGCGIGGPARWIASAHGCHITGIDLTAAFCEAAQRLNAVTGLSERVGIVQGSATAMPFADAAFDKVYSQYVLMNIADKPAFDREALRVLRPGGRAVFTCAATGPAGVPLYPMPWASTSATSFLVSPGAMEKDLQAAGFEIVSFKDLTDSILPAMRAQRQKLADGPPPALGLHVFRGPQMAAASANMARSLEDGRLRTVEAVLRKSK